jgi:two-component system phosphate regulon response regulator PhoB
MTAAQTVRGDDARATVLVVDDDATSQREVRGHLEAAGHRVVGAHDGAAAFRQLSAQPVDLVLCEVTLSDMDGFEVCRAIKQAPATADIPVVMLVAAADDLLRRRAQDAGADDVALKSTDGTGLLTLVRAQLRITGL